MKFLIVGGNFGNRGAQLMLLSTVKTLSEIFPNSEICVSRFTGTSEQIRSLGVLQLRQSLPHVGQGNFHRRYVLEQILDNFPLWWRRNTIPFQNLTAIFDISGFAYSDQWGVMPIRNLNSLLDWSTRYGIKYIVLPQAFGPFDSPESKLEMQKALNRIDLVYARDQESLSFLYAISQTANVQIAPDLTIALGQAHVIPKPYCCFVPNVRVLDKGAEIWEAHYHKLLKEMLDFVQNNTSMDIVFIQHDEQDMPLIETLIHDVEKTRLRLFADIEALKLKIVLAESEFVVGSRFHALVSALSCSVPCLGLGWSHKYRMLFTEYNIPQYVFSEPAEDIISRFRLLATDQKERENVRGILQKKNEEYSDMSQRMWMDIKHLLTSTEKSQEIAP